MSREWMNSPEADRPSVTACKLGEKFLAFMREAGDAYVSRRDVDEVAEAILGTCLTCRVYPEEIVISSDDEFVVTGWHCGNPVEYRFPIRAYSHVRECDYCELTDKLAELQARRMTEVRHREN